jgi:hypothetical protein
MARASDASPQPYSGNADETMKGSVHFEVSLLWGAMWSLAGVLPTTRNPSRRFSG